MVRCNPLVQANEVLRPGVDTRLFPQLARGGLQQRFIGLEMAGRLVEGQPDLGFLLDQQELAVATNNGGNGNGGSNAGNTGVNNAADRNPSGTQPLSKTGADVSGIASAFILIAAAGVTIMMIRRKHAI